MKQWEYIQRLVKVRRVLNNRQLELYARILAMPTDTSEQRMDKMLANMRGQIKALEGYGDKVKAIKAEYKRTN